MLARLEEFDAAFKAAQEEKSSWVVEGIARLHGLIRQLEAKRLPQVRPCPSQKHPPKHCLGGGVVLNPLFSPF